MESKEYIDYRQNGVLIRTWRADSAANLRAA
jgi:hypothetical protein